MWHFLNKLWRSVLLILCLHRCNNSTIVDKFFNNYVKIQIEKTKIVCLAFTHVLESTISRKKITTRRRVKHRYMAMTISNHGWDSHLASQSVHFIWKSRLNENSQPPLPMLQLTKYLLLLPERICNTDLQNWQSSKLWPDITIDLSNLKHSALVLTETPFKWDMVLGGCVFQTERLQESREGVQWLLSTLNIPIPTQSKLWAPSF